MSEIQQPDSPHKPCGRCGESKPFSDYVKHYRGKFGLGSWCKPCRKTWWKEYIIKHPEKVQDRTRKTRYGIDKATFDNMLAVQGHKCAICRRAYDSTKPREWAIDHDHDCCRGNGRKICGKCVREILCRGCNSMLGHARDNPFVLYEGEAYLRKWNKKTDGLPTAEDLDAVARDAHYAAITSSPDATGYSEAE